MTMTPPGSQITRVTWDTFVEHTGTKYSKLNHAVLVRNQPFQDCRTRWLWRRLVFWPDLSVPPRQSQELSSHSLPSVGNSTGARYTENCNGSSAVHASCSTVCESKTPCTLASVSFVQCRVTVGICYAMVHPNVPNALYLTETVSVRKGHAHERHITRVPIYMYLGTARFPSPCTRVRLVKPP